MNTVPRPEHPRPDRLREHWMTLNGSWDFAFDEKAMSETLLIPMSLSCCIQ